MFYIYNYLSAQIAYVYVGKVEHSLILYINTTGSVCEEQVLLLSMFYKIVLFMSWQGVTHILIWFFLNCGIWSIYQCWLSRTSTLDKVLNGHSQESSIYIFCRCEAQQALAILSLCLSQASSVFLCRKLSNCSFRLTGRGKRFSL